MNSTKTTPSETIHPEHFQEWAEGSAVDPDIIQLNLRSISDLEVDPISREVSTPVADLLNWQYTRFGYQVKAALRGWWVSGIDPLNNYEPMEWGRFKPDSDTPVIDRFKNEVAKYLSPKGTPSRATFLRVSWEIGLKIARSHGYEETYINRILQAHTAVTAKAQSRKTSSAVTEIGDFSKAVLPRGSGRVASPVLPPRSFLRTEDSTFWQWVHTTPISITLTEGEKKAGCLLSSGYVAIALPGITTGVRTKDQYGNPCIPHLIAELKFFTQTKREFRICFDHETKPKTIRNVERETEKLKTQLTKAGCTIRVISLPGPQKGVDDFVVANGAEAFDSLYATSPNFEAWQAQRYSRLTHTPDLELNQQYLGNLEIPAAEKLILLKSPKGSGKTESFKKIVEDANQVGQRVLLLTHRVQLGQAICDRVGLPYVSELRTAQEGAYLGYGLCIDSLHPESQARFNADDWHDPVLIIDECEQFIWHLLAATTEVSNRRLPILGQLKKLLINVLESDRGKIILSDADLSDLSVEFIWSLLEQQPKPYTVVNHYKPDEPWYVAHYSQSTPEKLLAAMDEELSGGGVVFCLTQAKQSKARYSTINLEALVKERYPEKRVLRIDSATVADPSHPAYLCTSKLNEIVTQYDFVVASPVIETGVSIDVRGHFTSVFGFFYGVTPDSSTRQALARVRDAVPRHIWATKYGIGKVANGSTSTKAILRAEYELSKVSAKLVQLLSFDDDLVQSYGSILSIWAKMAARINSGLIHYRESVLSGLTTEGHIITDGGFGGNTKPILEKLTACRDDSHKAECEAIAQADEITPKQFEESKSKKAKTEAEQYKERKHTIQQRYQVEVTPDLVSKDADGWYPKLRLFYFLNQGRPFVQERDRQSLEQIAETGGWMPTLNRSQYSVKVYLLESLGLQNLLDLDTEFHGGTKAEDYEDAHPTLLRLAKTAKRNAWVIKTGLGLTITESMSPMQIVQLLLGKIGIKLTCTGQVGAKGHRQRCYIYEQPKDGRDTILNNWFTRDKLNRNDSEMHTPSKNNLYQGVAA